MSNTDIRKAAKTNNVRFWEIAAALSISEATFTRWMRFELSEEKRKLIFEAIKDIAGKKKGGAENAAT